MSGNENKVFSSNYSIKRFAVFFLIMLLWIPHRSISASASTIARGYVTPEMFGAVGDGIVNDTAAFEKMTVMMNENMLYAVLTKCYLVDSVTLPRGCMLLSEGGSLKKNPKNEKNYSILELGDNCIVEGLTLIGDRDKNYTNAEWGHCLRINGSNCVVRNCTMKDAHGDGIYIRGNNARISSCQIDRAYRNGISVTNGLNFLIEDTVIRNVAGTAPQFGIDIEPNYPNDLASGLIKNVNIINCQGGILIYLGEQLKKPAYIQCVDTTVEKAGARRSVSLYSANDSSNELLFDNISIIEPSPNAQSFVKMQFKGSDNPKLYFNCSVINGTNENAMEIEAKNPACNNPMDIILRSNGWRKKGDDMDEDIIVDSSNKNISIYTNLDVKSENYTTSVFHLNNQTGNE